MEEQISPPADEHLVTLGKWTFSLGGIVEDFQILLERFRDSVKHWSDRGPDPDAQVQELTDLVTIAAREGARRATIDIGTYNEGDPKWNHWILAALALMSLLSVIDLCVLISVEHHLAQIEQKVSP